MKRFSTFICFIIYSMMCFSASYTPLEKTKYVEGLNTANMLFDSGYQDSKPCFVDFDNNGVMDMIIGSTAGSLVYYKNVGTVDSFSFDEVVKPFITIGNEEKLSVCTSDFNLDGIIDLVVGTASGRVYYLKNTGSTDGNDLPIFEKIELFNSLFPNCKPAVSDLDGDGKIDLCLGGDSSTMVYYLNSGDLANENEDLRYEFNTPVSGTISVPGYQYLTPFFFNNDGDSEMELLCGEKNGHLIYLDKVDAKTPEFTIVNASYAGINLGSSVKTAPFIVNLNGGENDLVLGTGTGNVQFYEGLGNDQFKFLYNQIGFTDFSLSYSESSSALMGDFDFDGDLDLIMTTLNKIQYYENQGDVVNLIDSKWKLKTSGWAVASDGETNLATLVIDVLDMQLTDWDYDNDGDLDIFFGNKSGGVGFIENIGTKFSPKFILRKSGNRDLSINLFDNMKMINGRTSLAFADFDSDGDEDLPF